MSQSPTPPVTHLASLKAVASSKFRFEARSACSMVYLSEQSFYITQLLPWCFLALEDIFLCLLHLNESFQNLCLFLGKKIKPKPQQQTNREKKKPFSFSS